MRDKEHTKANSGCGRVKPKTEKIAVIILVILLITVFISPSHAGEAVPEVLRAYRALNIPVIDGIKSPGEWSDTESYLSEQAVPPDMTVAGNKGIMTLCLKHDTDNLYILFTVNDDDYDSNNSAGRSDCLTIFWERNYTAGLIIYSNGSIYNGSLMMNSAILPDGPAIEGGMAKAGVSYNQDNYTFEMAIKISLFAPSSENEIHCSITYTDANYTGSSVAGITGNIHSIGFSNSASNTVILLSETYQSGYSQPFMWILGVAMIIVIVGVLLKIKKGERKIK